MRLFHLTWLLLAALAPPTSASLTGLPTGTSQISLPLECVVKKKTTTVATVTTVHPTLDKTVASRGGADVSSALLQRLKVGFYFALWYALNIVYNILNKRVLNVLPSPLIVGSMQFGVGSLYVLTLWLLQLRPTPSLTPTGKNTLSQVGFWHCIGQLFSIVSLGAGPVSFTHIVKALEPFFSALVSAFIFGKWMKPQVYATLIPVVSGVGYACMKERYFSWLAFWTAMGSNVSFALRAVLSKQSMTAGDVGANMSPTNTFGVVTMMAFLISMPIGFIMERGAFLSLWEEATKSQTSYELARAIVISGFFHYINNEVMFMALSNVHPVTLAVGNTMKRVFIMVASVMVFRNEISLQAGIGSAVGIGGVLLYSLSKQHYENMA